jgi:hypothetical protein
VFVQAVPDATAYAFRRTFVLVVLVDVGWQVYREVGRVRVPAVVARAGA